MATTLIDAHHNRKMADQNEKAEEAKTEGDSILAEINQKIVDTFETFDHENNQTVDKR